MHSGAVWCRARRRAVPRRKRFSVTLDRRDYDELLALAERHRPPLSLQYVVSYAVQRLLRDAKNPQLVLKMGDPLDG